MRNNITKEYYPDEMTLHEYVLGIKDAANGFEDNMDKLKAGGEDNKKFIEEWHTTFGAWCEIFNPPIDMKSLVRIYRDYEYVPLGATKTDVRIHAFFEEVLNELGIVYE